MNVCLRPSLLLLLLVWLSVTGHGTARPPWPSGSGSGNADRSQRPQGRNQPCHGGHGREQRARLRRVLLANGTAVCNDGSPAGYYIRKRPGNRRWILFLEGGWHCYDDKSCAGRWMRTRQLMSSLQWPDSRQVGGILSANREENQYWWNANHVLVPYCSSDAWSGATNGKTDTGYAFMGSLILQSVVRELLGRGLYEGKLLLLAGSSAGGAGVLLNVDRIADLLASLGSKVKVRGVVDSGWFLDNDPFEARECLEPHSCAPVETIKRGIRLWNGQVPDRCRPLYSDYEQWRCYFGYRIYPTLKAPTFVFQWVFDEAQMAVNNVAAPSSKAHWDYIHALGSKLRSTLMNVTALFAPSCISHEILTKRNWQAIEICGISLPQALRCWELQKHEHNHHEHHSNHNLYDRLPARENETSFLHRNLGDVSATVTTNGHAQKTKTRRRNMKTRRKNCRHNRKGLKKARKGEYSATSGPLRPEEPRRRSRERPGSRHAQHRWRLHEDLCQHWLMDSCAWPQCNRRCPRMLDPMTGRELRFSDLLRSFGLDVAAVAAALGLDQAALAAMEPDALLHAD
ncbi:palmitoleoyl-protein carboxylesterase NOTUM [Dermacentor andersoni]|uniref:palmitoleoyl-protein carboxylesterase NOTUM n=1 Tax=Dermacentor andersoni TaxID=34620 RepID=UPI002155A838|nr:palmitoleoyl-protein carboxylesterase notum1-like [Dermacentor andersoni]